MTDNISKKIYIFAIGLDLVDKFVYLSEFNYPRFYICPKLKVYQAYKFKV